ncbi:hypothetical protein ACLF6K_37490 [Streptomyces xanthophaeus]|uniref:hypothetical protein n=1 Tax=Streptomyces xanthophaeus TaxID=67385 RepID=UPI0039902DDF
MPIKRCKASFAASVNGTPHMFNVGQLVDADDPVIKGREALFEDVETYMSARGAQVEQATAEPGDRRSVGRPAKKTASRRPDPAPAETKDEKEATP